METAIVSLIIITVALFGALTITHVYLSSQDAILASWREMEERLGERARTDLSPIRVEMQESWPNIVDVTLGNEGDTKLADFDQWDVIVQYDTDNDGDHDVVEWLSYHDPPSNSEWSENIGEVFEPDIFNPGEVMTITLVVSSAEITRTGVAIIGTPNGITTSAAFTR
jgi:hypothetical protein